MRLKPEEGGGIQTRPQNMVHPTTGEQFKAQETAYIFWLDHAAVDRVYFQNVAIGGSYWPQGLLLVGAIQI